jgi:hypothetical protein
LHDDNAKLRAALTMLKNRPSLTLMDEDKIIWQAP